jgi:hypothetical protein
MPQPLPSLPSSAVQFYCFVACSGWCLRASYLARPLNLALWHREVRIPGSDLTEAWLAVGARLLWFLAFSVAALDCGFMKRGSRECVCFVAKPCGGLDSLRL